MIGRTSSHTGSEGAILHRAKARFSPREAAVYTEYLPDHGPLPLVVRPAVPRLNLVGWAGENDELIDSWLLEHGAILFRGFGVKDIDTFRSFAVATSSGSLLDNQNGPAPRRGIKDAVHTSREQRANCAIQLHNEMSDSMAWPMKVWFCCLKPAAAGGETSIADGANVFDRLDSETRERFMSYGVKYVRTYGNGRDRSLREGFGSTEREKIEEICRGTGIEFDWQGSGRLRTSQTCQAIAVHPGTGRTLWFNQAHLWHSSALKLAEPLPLLASLGVESSLQNAYYGDGSPIDLNAVNAVRRAYEDEKVTFTWRQGDILMLDNMSIAHGREPYTGERRVVVAMAELSLPEAPPI